jgi:hypothetical protein
MDDPDPKLLALFSAAPPLDEAAFMARFVARLARAQRAARRRRLALVAAAALIFAWVAPALLRLTGLVLTGFTVKIASLAPLLVSPAGWAISMAVGLLVMKRLWRLAR